MKENEPELFAKIKKICCQKIIWHIGCQAFTVPIILMLPDAAFGCEEPLLVPRDDGYFRDFQRSASGSL